jgi:hypothetical protein
MRNVVVERCEPGIDYRVKLVLRSIYYVEHWKEIKQWLADRDITHRGVFDCLYFVEEEDAEMFLLAWEHRL